MVVMKVPVQTVVAIRQYLGRQPHDDVHELISSLHGLPIIEEPDAPLDVKPPRPCRFDATPRTEAMKVAVLDNEGKVLVAWPTAKIAREAIAVYAAKFAEQSSYVPPRTITTTQENPRSRLQRWFGIEPSVIVTEHETVVRIETLDEHQFEEAIDEALRRLCRAAGHAKSPARPR